jgi:sugar phosphate isomerase/epimerase
MRFGICVYTEDIASAERAGYEFVELTVTNVVPAINDTEFRDLKKRLRGFSIRPEAWRRFIPSSLPVVGPTVDFSKLTEFVKTTLARIGELGGHVVVFGSPGARNVPEGFSVETAHSQLVRFLEMAAEEASQNSVTIVIEPIRNNCNIINSISEAVVLAKAVNRKEVKVLADLYHMASEGESVEAITTAGGDLCHIHLPVPEIPGMSEPRSITDRLPDYPIDDFLEQLWKLNYSHRISVEDLDRKFMNLEREAPQVLSYLGEKWNLLMKAN